MQEVIETKLLLLKYLNKTSLIYGMIYQMKRDLEIMRYLVD